eukprot:6211519-Pleurochrysis_carterae.AAC.1
MKRLASACRGAVNAKAQRFTTATWPRCSQAMPRRTFRLEFPPIPFAGSTARTDLRDTPARNQRQNH